MAARRRSRILSGIFTVLLLGGAAVGVAVLVSRHRSTSTTAPTASVLKAVAVTGGDLVKTDKASGTFGDTDGVQVLHRIEGQSPLANTVSASPSSSSSSSNRNNGGGNQTPAGIAAVDIAAVDIAAVDVLAAPPGGTTTTSPCPPGDTTTTTADPTSTTGATTTTEETTSAEVTTSTEPASTETTSPGPGTTAPRNNCGGGQSGGVGGGATAAGRTSGRGSTGVAGASGGTSSSNTRVTQMVTSIVTVGRTVDNGDTLYTVDGRPAIALLGALPAWRTLSTTSTAGLDVQQLEQSLVALGYDPDKTVAVDTTFDAQTKAMVKRWQQGVGLDVTGSVTLGSVVYIPAARSVRSVTAKVGDAVSDGSPMLLLAGRSQQVVIDVPTGDESLVVPGLQVTLAGGGTGTVSVLRSADESGTVVVQAIIVPDKPLDGVDEGATVSVTLSTLVVPNALIVPSDALVSHLDGSYAVQVQQPDGSLAWKTVQIVAVVGSKTAISGDGIAAGLQVMVPV
jgi:hypothetical protein